MNNITSAEGKALSVLLIGLCSSDEDHEILNALCNKVIKITEDTVEFEDFEFNYQKVEDIVPDSNVPESFGEIASVVASLTWDGGGPEVGFELTDDGVSGADGWIFDEIEDEDEKERIKSAGKGDPMDAFTGGQNALFFDPTRKLTNGEPALAFVSHESCEWEEVRSVDSFNYKQIFLRMLSDQALSSNYIPEIYF